MDRVKNLVEGISFSREIDRCVHCIIGKAHREPFPLRTTKTNALLELIHSDVCGPILVQSISGSLYFLTFIDDFSRKACVFFKCKSEVPAIFGS